jgi:ankyrin repeat protein
LSAAVENENPELVEILLQAGADPNLSGSASTTPLHLAAQHESAEIVAALLNAGAEVDPTVFMSGSPLNLGAGDFEVLKLLLEAGADPNGHSARSPLQTALREGNIDGARLLLTYGADPDGGAKKDASKPIYMAAAAGREELFFDLFERGSVLDWASKDAQNLLIGAIERGHEQIVEALLDNGVDVNQRLGLHTALYNSNDSMAVLLIERGADIGATDERGRTPLHLAAWRKCLLSAEMLLDWGADINAQTLSHDTPLHFSVGQTGTRETRLMIEILLERGADSQIVNDASETAYDKATTYQKELIRKSEENLRENQRNVAREE